MLRQILLATAALSGLLLLSYYYSSQKELTSTTSELFYRSLFKKFKDDYHKNYSSLQEENYRFKVFAENSRMIDDHNKSGASYTLEMNQLGDQTFEELKHYYLADMNAGDLPTCDGEIPNNGHSSVRQKTLFSSQKNIKIKSTKRKFSNKGLKKRQIRASFVETDDQKVDWNAAGFVTPIKNQKQCGSCYAFSAIAAIESLYAINNNKQILLSEQQAVDCSKDYGNHGCGGGLISRVFHYAMEHSLETESDYPYHGSSGTCQEDTAKAQVKLSKCVKVETDMEGLIAAIRKQPVSVAFEALPQLFFYKFGVYDPWPFKCGEQVNHAVLAVGFDLGYKKPYLLIKNSWGSWWGRSGYLYMAIGTDPKGTCNVAGSGHNYVPVI